MRVLLVNTSFPPVTRSAAHLYHQMGKRLIANGHDVDVVTELPWRRLIDGDGFEPPDEVDGMRVRWTRSYRFAENSMVGRGINAIGLPRAFYRAIPEPGRHDVSFVYSPPITLGLAGARLKRRHGVPFVLNVQDIYPKALIDLGLIDNKAVAGFFSRIESRVYKAADRIVVHSDGNARYLEEHHPHVRGKVEVVPNWIDLSLFDPDSRGLAFREAHGLGDSFVVAYAGTMGYAQELGPLLDAAARLGSARDISILMIGEGVRLQEWKERAAGASNVRFMPLQSNESYPDVIAAMDVGIVSLSSAVTTPVVPGKLLDLMAGARPIIANVPQNNDTRKFIDAADCGFSMDPDDGEAMASAIEALYEDRARAELLGQNGRTYAAEHFSIDVCGAKLEAIFAELSRG